MPYLIPFSLPWFTKSTGVKDELRLADTPTPFEYLQSFLKEVPIEGIVWHHEDGRMAKIKRKDFGLPWPVKP